MDNEEKIQLPEYEKQKLPPDLEEKTLEVLREKRLVGISQSIGLKRLVYIVLFGAFFFCGWFFGHNNKAGNTIPGTEGSPTYLLLLHNPAGFISDNSHVKEYTQWFNALKKEDKVISGEELNDKLWIISKENKTGLQVDPSSTSGEGNISGFFLINAASEREAKEIAYSCPHVKYNGIVQLRPIQNHPESK